MSDATFLEQARLATIELFHAYCHENNMVKALSFFSKESCFIGWGEQEIYLDHQAISATFYERLTAPYELELVNMHAETIHATESFCVVLFTANVIYEDKKGITITDLERATLVFRKEQGKPKIVYLHSSAAGKLHNLGRIIPLEHGVEATRLLTNLECDRSMAIDMCNHTPNGLVYCQISEHYPLV
ncbi:MAG: YybH family protein, partial [Phascolarctobacterium sp.]